MNAKQVSITHYFKASTKTAETSEAPKRRIPFEPSESKRKALDTIKPPPVHKAPSNSSREKRSLKELRPQTQRPTLKKQDQAIELSPEQLYVLDLIVEKGKNVFFTGPAGVGKSLLLREVIKKLHEKYGELSDAVQVTASTGMAASHIGGGTLHSFIGCGLANQEMQILIGMARRNGLTLQRWKRTAVLIIDEISMVDGDFFDKIEELARRLRYSDKDFGGIQLVLCGDFFQLPPVPDRKAGKNESKFCFEANCWNRVVHETVQLTRVFRQKDDTFVNILNEMRVGNITQKHVDILRALERDLPDTGVKPVELYPMKVQVNRANGRCLEQIKEPEVVFQCDDDFKGPDSDAIRKKLENACSAPSVLTLKKGAQVMLLMNLNQDVGLVNGCLGIVQDFHEENGMPNVLFKTSKGDLLRTVQRVEWKLEENHRLIATRSQVPLDLAWAISVHKAQGQTIPLLRVDLGRTFERGQAYVALSRAVSLDTIQLLNFHASKVSAHPKVIEFSKSLKKISENELAPFHQK